jgi:hypothetical protein
MAAPVPESPKERWEAIKATVSKSHPAMAAHLTQCRLAEAKDDEVVIEAGGNEFSVKQIQKARNRQVLEDMVRRYFGPGKSLRFEARPESSSRNYKAQRDRQDNLRQEALDHPLVADVIEIFNGQIIDVKLPKENEK